jgi:hypothetical protein
MYWKEPPKAFKIDRQGRALLLETMWLLSQFGKKRKDAEKNYRHFVEDAAIEVIGNPSDNIVGGFILGATDFVNWVKDTFLRPGSDVKEIPRLRKLKNGGDHIDSPLFATIHNPFCHTEFLKLHLLWHIVAHFFLTYKPDSAIWFLRKSNILSLFNSFPNYLMRIGSFWGKISMSILLRFSHKIAKRRNLNEAKEFPYPVGPTFIRSCP